MQSHVSKQTKEYVRNKTDWRWVLLLKEFTSNPLPNTIPHSCCDMCAGKYKCLCDCPDKEQCSCSKTCISTNHQSLLYSTTTTSNNENNGRKLKPERAKQVRDNLLEYHLQLAGDLKHEQLPTGLDLVTGLTRTLIDSIVESARELSRVQMLMKKFSFYKRKHA